MKFVFLLFLLCATNHLMAQYNEGVLLGANMDLIKSDYDRYFEKVQIGLEANYFLSERFTATGGIEIWSQTGASAVVGSRWYPIKDAFIRARGMIGKNNDFTIGGGWAKPMTETLRFESMADFYFGGTFSIRAGVAVIVR